jgi:hypothetical protein
MVIPFEEHIDGDIYIRTFSSDVRSNELKWHFDEEDRIIESTGITDWKFQLDNKLPQKISGKIHIPKGEWHRIIKGTGSLEIRVKKMS